MIFINILSMYVLTILLLVIVSTQFLLLEANGNIIDDFKKIFEPVDNAQKVYHNDIYKFSLHYPFYFENSSLGWNLFNHKVSELASNNTILHFVKSSNATVDAQLYLQVFELDNNSDFTEFARSVFGKLNDDAKRYYNDNKTLINEKLVWMIQYSYNNYTGLKMITQKDDRGYVFTLDDWGSNFNAYSKDLIKMIKTMKFDI